MNTFFCERLLNDNNLYNSYWYKRSNNYICASCAHGCFNIFDDFDKAREFTICNKKPTQQLNKQYVVCDCFFHLKSNMRLRQTVRLIEEQPLALVVPDFDDEIQRKDRSFRFNSSDTLPGVLCSNQYMSPDKAMRTYRNQITEEERKKEENNTYRNEILKYGRNREPIILKMFHEWTKKPSNCIRTCGTFQKTMDKKKNIIISATPDALFWNEHLQIYETIEIKSKWYKANGPALVPLTAEHIPTAHVIQVWAQLYCTGLYSGYYVVHSEKENKLVIFQMKFEEEEMKRIALCVQGYLKFCLACDPFPKRVSSTSEFRKESTKIFEMILKKMNKITCL